jgi:hypothetical protein
MKLADAVEQLRNARAAHKAWVARAEALIEGMNVDKEHIPMLPTDCVFGKWYYGSGQALRKLPAYKSIEKSHDNLHRIYMQIFKLLFNEPDISTWEKLFGKAKKAKKAKAEQVKEAQILFKRLQSISDDVCDFLENLEEQLMTAAKKQKINSTIHNTLG